MQLFHKLSYIITPLLEKLKIELLESPLPQTAVIQTCILMWKHTNSTIQQKQNIYVHPIFWWFPLHFCQ